jgi:hypothetical protein
LGVKGNEEADVYMVCILANENIEKEARIWGNITNRCADESCVA